MKFITQKEIEDLNDNYFVGRWDYFQEVIDEVRLMDNINSTLELGPYKTPLVKGGDVIDVTDGYLKYYPIDVGRFYKHDCSVTPYPVKDKQYDLVIACQVLEHLGRNQVEVFEEFSRIAKKAIITLPYKLSVPCDVHHMIDEKVIDTWAQGLKPVFEKIIHGRISRIIRVYNFDDSITSLKYNKKLQEHADFQVLNELKQERKKRIEFEKVLSDKDVLLEEERGKRLEFEKVLSDKDVLLEEERSKRLEFEREILNSNSWKFTKPFRKLRSMFK